MAKLNKKERAWLEEFQEMLNRCPSKRLSFATIGDPFLLVFDKTREDEIYAEIESNGGEFISAAARLKADFEGYTLDFPNAVHSTAG